MPGLSDMVRLVRLWPHQFLYFCADLFIKYNYKMNLSYIINTTILLSLKCYYITINSTINQWFGLSKSVAQPRASQAGPRPAQIPSLAQPDHYFSFILGQEKFSQPNIKEKQRSGYARLPKYLLCPHAIQIAKRSRYLNRTLKYSIEQPVGQVVPCQLTQSSRGTNHNAIMYIRGSTQSAAILEISSAQVYIYTYISYIQAIVVVEYIGLEIK